MSSPPPLYDDHGINLADPKDRLGLKTAYITHLQTVALRRILGDDVGRVLDLGCGYGRTLSALSAFGWDLVGAEPSVRVLQFARRALPEGRLVAAALPNLPFTRESFDTVLLLNVVRSLHLLGVAGIVARAADYLARRGRLVVLDNIRPGHRDYVDEGWLIELFRKEGLQLKERRAIRSSRWLPIYAIRYGLVAPSRFARIAEWELSRMAKAGAPRFGYHNVIFVFARS